MIFDENFDRSLWLIIENDKKNRNKIVDFIENIPCEFVMKIRDSLDEYNKYKLENDEIPFKDRKYRSFNGEIYDGKGYLYYFNIDIEKDMLYISRSVYRNGVYYIDFTISLLTCSRDVDYFLQQDVGSISYCHNNQIGNLDGMSLESYTNVSYKRMNTLFGNILLASINDKKIRLCGINQKEISGDYQLCDVSNKLVRSKKRSTRKEKK